MAVDACCCEEGTCAPCPDGTIYPWAVDVTFPSIGVSVPAGNELDPEEDGEDTFTYRVEGSFGGYSFQCLFGDCEASVSIIRDSDGLSICVGGGSTSVISMEATSCPVEPGDPLVLVYTIPCSGGGSISVVISG